MPLAHVFAAQAAIYSIANKTLQRLAISELTFTAVLFGGLFAESSGAVGWPSDSQMPEMTRPRGRRSQSMRHLG